MLPPNTGSSNGRKPPSSGDLRCSRLPSNPRYAKFVRFEGLWLGSVPARRLRGFLLRSLCNDSRISPWRATLCDVKPAIIGGLLENSWVSLIDGAENPSKTSGTHIVLTKPIKRTPAVLLRSKDPRTLNALNARKLIRTSRLTVTTMAARDGGCVRIWTQCSVGRMWVSLSIAQEKNRVPSRNRAQTHVDSQT